MITEEWKTIVGYEGRYAVSNTGKIRRERVDKLDNRGRTYKRHSLLSFNADRNGYQKAWLWNRNARKRDGYPIHRLVAEYFIGPCPPEKNEINHKDGDKGNNHVDNLEWVTHRENMQHSWRELGRKAARGSRASKAKLAESDIPVIRALIQKGVSERKIAKRFGVSHVTIGQIKRGKAWAHITDTRLTKPVQLSLW